MARFVFLTIKINLTIGGVFGLLSRERLNLNMFMFTDIIMIRMVSLIITYYVHSLIQVVGYKGQDQLGHREICKDYSTSDWFLNNLGATCNICNCELIYTIHASVAVSSNITADRINTTICHSLSNCKV